jgi:hypothetical protein
LPNINKQYFEYSKLNDSSINEYSKRIIDFMNDNFDEFKDAGTAGVDVIMPKGSEMFANWIVTYYREKGVEFFITNGYTILSIQQFSEFFDVKAKYRVKRSGSRPVSKKDITSLSNYIKNNFDITKIEVDSNKMFVSSLKQLHNKRFIFNGIEYMLSARGDKYEVRALSNTFNANVIFSIEMKLGKRGLSIKDFIPFLISD